MGENTTYLVGIDDLFRVENADSKEEAEQIALKRFGEEGWEPYEATVVDVLEE